MKKLFIVLSVICALALGGGVYSYAYVPNTCKSVSGARVHGEYSSSNSDNYYVHLYNYSGSRCSASFTVEGKIDGVWECLGDGILTADDGDSDPLFCCYEYHFVQKQDFRKENKVNEKPRLIKVAVICFT